MGHTRLQGRPLPLSMTNFARVSLGLAAVTGIVLTSPALSAAKARIVRKQAQSSAAETGSKPTQTKSPNAPPAKPNDSEPFIIERVTDRAVFENDGTSRNDFETVVRVQSGEAVDQFGQLVFGYNAANQKLEVVSVAVKKAGAADFTSDSAVQDVVAAALRGAPAYANYREKLVSVPGLRAGDTLSYHIRTTTTSPLIPGQFWFRYDFVYGPIALDEQLEISVPLDRAIKLKTRPGFDPAITEENGRRIYRWRTAHAAHDSKLDGDQTSSAEAPGPAVQLTTYQSWEDFGRWYAAVENARAAPDASIRAQADALTLGRNTAREKEKALYDFVSTKIRSVSLSFGHAGYQPQSAGEILTNQYADSHDKHTLLASLLAAEGIPAYPALLSSASDIDPDMPSPGQFDHVLTVIPQGSDDQQWLWLDTATEVAPFRVLPASLRAKRALVISVHASGDAPAASARFLTTPADLPEPALELIEVTGRISPLGKLTAHVRYSMTGDNALGLRIAFHRTAKSDWKQLGEVLSAGDGFHGDVTGVKSGDPLDTSKPFEVDYDLAQPKFFVASKDQSELPLPLPSLGFPEAAESTNAPAGPIRIGAPLEVRVKATIELPPGFSARVPVARRIERDYGTYQSSYTVKGGKIVAERTLRFGGPALPPERFEDLAAFVRAVRSDEAEVVAVKKTVAPAPPSKRPGR